MTVTAVRKDPQRLTLTVEAEFDTSVERVWQLWADPRKLERWWGPPTYPATFTKHDLAPGGRVESHMTGPAGDQPHGFWDVLEVEPPRRILFRAGFANADDRHNGHRRRSDAGTRREGRGPQGRIRARRMGRAAVRRRGLGVSRPGLPARRRVPVRTADLRDLRPLLGLGGMARKCGDRSR